MKALKIESQIKNLMAAFVAKYGLSTIDTTIDGIRYSVFGATRFSTPQIKVFHPEYGTWMADYTNKISTPKHVQQLPTGGWVLVK